MPNLVTTRCASLLAVLLLCGCSGAPTSVLIPNELTSCPKAPAAVPVPATPRSVASVIAWGNATDRQRIATVAALKECSDKLERLLALVKGDK